MRELYIYLALFATAAVFIAVQAYIARRDSRIYLKKKIKKQWGNIPDKEYDEKHFDNITHYFRKKIPEGYYVDDITWNDLNMDNIFMLVNHTYSSVGEEYLYAMLRQPVFQNKDLEANETVITYFEEHPDEAQKFQEIYSGLGYTHKISLYDYLYRLQEFEHRSNIKHYLCGLLFLFSIGVMFYSPPVGILLSVFMLGYNVISYFAEKSKIESFFNCFQYLAKMLSTAEAVLKRGQAEELSVPLHELKQQVVELKGIRRGMFLLTGNGMSGSIADIIMDYIRMIFHVDLIKFNSMLNTANQKMKEIDGLFSGLGRLEACIAVASFRHMLTYYCKPEFVESKASFLSVEEIYHPSIEHPVANDLQEQRGVLITGSNASGKSTFLKTIAINGIFAQTIHTCTAASYQGNYFEIYSSMALRDDLQSQESYYMVEIKSLKRILDKIDHSAHILCCIDEVLRGTNTVERIAASAHILKSLSRENVLCFAATHDIELTHILEDYYANYHFQEEVEGDDIIFHYHLYEGRATSRNAIKLLGIMGYQQEIIQAAENAAENFLKNGVWTKCY